jgi:hypothetical protein
MSLVTKGDFPPITFSVPEFLKSNADHPTPPYLVDIPDIIDASKGRQLFVDDYLIESMSNLNRVYHQAKAVPNPIITPSQPYEKDFTSPLPDAVIYDPISKEFRLWYVGIPAVRAFPHTILVAKSYDGIHWYKPHLLDHKVQILGGCCKKCDARAPQFQKHGRNMLGAYGGCRDGKGRGSGTVLYDPDIQDPNKRFILIFGASRHASVYYSPDGLTWTFSNYTGKVGSSPWYVCRNPFRNKFVFTMRDNVPKFTANRVVRYKEIDQLTDTWGNWYKPTQYGMAGDLTVLNNNTPVYWCVASKQDRVVVKSKRIPGIYCAAMVAYESMMINFISIYQGGENLSKRICIHLGFSRDGFHYSRNFKAFIPERKDMTYMWACGGNMICTEKEIFIYYFGKNRRKHTVTNMSILRRDGFASIEAGDEPGVLETRWMTTDQKEPYLFINSVGEIRVEVLDVVGVRQGLDKKRCTPTSGDHTKQMVSWGKTNKIWLNKNKIKLRFHLQPGSKLYSFWFSPHKTGESMGYVGSGGPPYQLYKDIPKQEQKTQTVYGHVQVIGSDNQMYIRKLPKPALSIKHSDRSRTCTVKYADKSSDQFTVLGDKYDDIFVEDIRLVL